MKSVDEGLNFENQSRKPYQAPKIKQVKLVPDEAVLGGCKTLSYTIAVVGTTIGCDYPTFACLTDGS